VAESQSEPLRRGEHARRRVLSAALEVLAESGMPGFTIESVARRAGASKATLYRHWPSASALLVDAMDAEFRPLPDVASGDVRADMISVLTSVAGMLDRPPFPELMAAFIDAAERDPALAGLQASLTQRRREPLLRVVLEAARQGALPADVDPELVVDLLAAPFFYRRFVAHRRIPAEMPTLVVDHVLTALRRAPRDHRPSDHDDESGEGMLTPS
jgi:AcrR family transcriptional regulator